MTDREHSPAEKNRILRDALVRLQGRMPKSAWLATDTPWEALRAECLILASDDAFRLEFKQYLASRTIVRRSVATFFAQIAMAARARPDDVPVEHRPVASRGWFIGRWPLF